MGIISLDYFLNKEKEGIIFAKITKDKPSNSCNGTYFPYESYVEQVLDSSVNSDFEFSTVEPLDIAYGYFHYGNQITIVNFTQLAKYKKASDFSAAESYKKGCFDVNSLWVEKVMSLNDKNTFEYLFSHIPEETIMEKVNLAIEHLKNWKCDNGAQCLEEYIHKNEMKQEYTGENQMSETKGFIFNILSYIKRIIKA